MVQIFREVRRVLRNDGTLWLNLGDSYWSDTLSRKDPVESMLGNRPASDLADGRNNIPKENKRGGLGKRPDNLKPKDLVGIPWRVALALQADGWWLRSGLPWIKRSSMPESCSDRPSSALEYVFLLTKSPKYYFDMDAIRIPHQSSGKVTQWNDKEYDQDMLHNKQKNGKKGRPKGIAGFSPGGRNFRNTDLFFESLEAPFGMIFCGDEPVGIDVSPKGFKEAHFATFPPWLITPMILSGTSEKGCCVECGSPWERVVDYKANYKKRERAHAINNCPAKVDSSGWDYPSIKTIGWKPGCQCYKTEPFPEYPKQGRDEPDDEYNILAEPIRKQREYLLKKWKPLKTVPAVVMDIFFGSGTTGEVSEKFGRKFVGIELSKVYLDEIAIPRMKKKLSEPRLPGF